MRPINHFIVSGRAGGDGEHKSTSSGKDVVEFGLAHTRSQWDENARDWVEKNTTWYRVACFDKEAQEIARTIRKGDLLLVTGRLECEEYERRDGTPGFAAKILADHISVSLQPQRQKANADTYQQGGYGAGPAQAGFTPDSGFPGGDEAPF